MPEVPAQPPPWWSAFIAPSDEERAVAAAHTHDEAHLDCSPRPGGDTTPDET